MDVSWGAILKLAVAFFAFYIIYLIRDILVWVMFGLIISVLFDPAIDFLQRLRLSRTAAVFLVYISIFGLMGYLIYLIAPIFIIEIQQFTQLFPVYFEKIAPFLSGLGFDIFQSMDKFMVAVRDWLVNASSSIISSIASIFGNILLVLTVFTISIFFSLEERGMERLICLVLPRKYERNFLEVWHQSQIKISGWFATRFIGMAAVGVMTAIACVVIDIRYPIIFGFMAAILDIVPFIGPLIAGFIITLFALISSWQQALLILVVYTVINQIESNILTPILVRKFLQLPAILVLIAILIGERLWGPVGAVLAIPLFGILFDFTRDFLEKNKD